MGVVAKMPATAHIPVVFVFHPFLCQTDTTPAWSEVGNRWRSVTTTAHTLPRTSRIADALEDHRPFGALLFGVVVALMGAAACGTTSLDWGRAYHDGPETVAHTPTSSVTRSWTRLRIVARLGPYSSASRKANVHVSV
ncbi:hypothetical protein BD309DRAFT_953223 [Dichomitus squalens]|uniref:Uncharacterized protein n=1 Tax=Dichomitus squalens TaxID=114155 RepID=A0A4Q9P026_9APHY|nr:hypothetical protein BD309DRAFT_953223 [Dichomitus squalens]TBU63034.1 hypothetical protein BD310DRAFT_917676 [Dichomitus squalens]